MGIRDYSNIPRELQKIPKRDRRRRRIAQCSQRNRNKNLL